MDIHLAYKAYCALAKRCSAIKNLKFMGFGVNKTILPNKIILTTKFCDTMTKLPVERFVYVGNEYHDFALPDDYLSDVGMALSASDVVSLFLEKLGNDIFIYFSYPEYKEYKIWSKNDTLESLAIEHDMLVA